MWDLYGGELIPLGFKSWTDWKESVRGIPAAAPESVGGPRPIPHRDVALALADDLVKTHHITDRDQIEAIRRQALEEVESKWYSGPQQTLSLRDIIQAVLTLAALIAIVVLVIVVIL